MEQQEIVKEGVYVILYRIGDNGMEPTIEYALFKRKQGWVGWEFLKGGVEENEHPSEAARREAKEEAGIDVQVEATELENQFHSQNQKRRTLHQFKVFYAKLGDEEITISEEHSEFRFVSLKEAKGFLTHDDNKRLLEEADKVIRQYEGL